MNEYLVEYIKDTINLFCIRKPIIHSENINKGIALFWKIETYQDTLWDMFGDKRTMKLYFNDLKGLFEDEYNKYILEINYCIAPVDIGDEDMYSRIILYYYPKEFYQNTNIFLVA